LKKIILRKGFHIVADEKKKHFSNNRIKQNVFENQQFNESGKLSKH
jgi:hypothetical protein